MQDIPVKSSLIMALGYDPETKRLYVTFRGGRRYVYEAVPQEVVDGLENADSAGVYFLKTIRDNYDFKPI